MNISRKWSLLFFIALYAAFAGMLYGGYVVYRGLSFYSHVKTPQRGLEGTIYRADPELGYAPIPGSRGAHVLPSKPDIPIQYDNAGFRVPQDYAMPDTQTRSRPLVLALGCSYTYGDACKAEDAFVWRAGQLLNGSSINAGGCGYALSHMVLLARQLIARYSPDYVLIQYSPWLIQRGRSCFAPSFYGKVTNPFFMATASGVEIHPPVFLPIVFDLPIDRYKKSPKNLFGALSFLVRVGLPLYAYEDFNMFAYHVRKRIGRIPLPASDASAIIKSAYGEILQIAHEAGSHPLFVVLGDGISPVPVPKEIKAFGVPVVDAYAELMSRLPEPTTEHYGRAYVHWSDGDPPEVIDAHPNPLAHEIIAHAIIAAIQSRSEKRGIHQDAASDSTRLIRMNTQ